jgi:glycosyltransferase involved in cell wall biosynthesis
MVPNMVSIILPSLNAREFLEQRMDSILEQTYGNWEAIVLDSHSDDGTWEYFEGIAAKDPRFRLHRIPRDGLYAALNRGIDLALGEFVHIATCDDTMAPTFLEETIAALRNHPEAGIAATDVQFIDRDGKDHSESRPEFQHGNVRTSTGGEIMRETNLRLVPHDFFLHFQFKTVYFSLTQLLVRREAITPSHHFLTDVGSIADFMWSMKMTSDYATVHLPKKLATWRIHGNQLSFGEDSSRAGNMLTACNKAILDYGQLDKKQSRALLLPCYRVVTQGNLNSPNWLTLGFSGLCYFLSALVSDPAGWSKGMAKARFGKAALKDSWIYFLMGLWDVRSPGPITNNAESGIQDPPLRIRH